MVTAMSQFPTSKENIALNLLFEWCGESRINRTYDEYMKIAAELSKLEACHAHVNQRLREMADAGIAPYQICYFKAGDRYPWYEDFPTSLSMETVRKAMCTENSVRIDYVTESHNVSGDDRAALLLPDPVSLTVQVEEPT
jgi:hypothetical protein